MSTTITLEPIADRVILQPHEAATHTDGGIALPDNSRAAPHVGTVVAVGPLVAQCRPGHIVWFEEFSGSDIKDGDTVYRILGEVNVLAIQHG